MNVQSNIPLSTLTTMKIGGNALYVVHVTTREELQQAYLDSRQLGKPIYVIGGGSNLIAHDEGFDGVIIRMEIPGIQIVANDEQSSTITAGGGELWDNLVKYTVDLELSGIEAMSGIPGTVGAAPVQNIGAYGQELANTFISLDAYDTQANTFVTLSWDDCGFSYRHSIFRGEQTGRYIICSVTLQLRKQPPEPPFYESLQQRLDAQGVVEYTPALIRSNVLAIRADKLPDPARLPNAGSFFKNPIIEGWVAEDIKRNYSDVTLYDRGDGTFKIAAGWLIEAVDLRGEELHNMKVHDGNAVVLVNHSSATYADLAAARQEIVTAVSDTFHITLEQEPLELSTIAT